MYYSQKGVILFFQKCFFLYLFFFIPSQQVSTQTFIFLIPSLSTYPTKWLKYLSQLCWTITQRDSVMSDFKRNILSWKFGILSIKWVISVLRIGHSPGCCESWHKMLQCFVWAPRWKFKVYFPCIYSTFTLQILTKYQHPSRKFWVYPLSPGVPVALRQSLTVGIVTLFDGSWGAILSSGRNMEFGFRAMSQSYWISTSSQLQGSGQMLCLMGPWFSCQVHMSSDVGQFIREEDLLVPWKVGTLFRCLLPASWICIRAFYVGDVWAIDIFID